MLLVFILLVIVLYLYYICTISNVFDVPKSVHHHTIQIN